MAIIHWTCALGLSPGLSTPGLLTPGLLVATSLRTAGTYPPFVTPRCFVPRPQHMARIALMLAWHPECPIEPALARLPIDENAAAEVKTPAPTASLLPPPARSRCQPDRGDGPLTAAVRSAAVGSRRLCAHGAAARSTETAGRPPSSRVRPSRRHRCPTRAFVTRCAID